MRPGRIKGGATVKTMMFEGVGNPLKLRGVPYPRPSGGEVLIDDLELIIGRVVRENAVFRSGGFRDALLGTLTVGRNHLLEPLRRYELQLGILDRHIPHGPAAIVRDALVLAHQANRFLQVV